MSRIWMATVHAADGVRLTTAGRRRTTVLARLALYIGRRAPHVLWPPDAARVAQLLHEGAVDAAVAHYFETVGRRWDEERLTVRAVRASGIRRAMS